MTHLTSPALTRGSPSSPPACAGGEDVLRRMFLFSGASLVLGGCFGKLSKKELKEEERAKARAKAA
jgi:hypothetical protein